MTLDGESNNSKDLQIDWSKPYLTYALIGANVLIWIMMTGIGWLKGWDVNAQLLYFGAKVNRLVADGQYWRLFSAMFLHVDIIHLFFNCYALLIYGRIVEQLYGKSKMAVIYVLAGLIGSILSYVLSPNPAAGASGAIFGLIGSLLYFRQKRTDIFKRMFGPSLFIIIAINLFYGFTGSGIDNWGHIGGLVGGLLTAYAVGLYRQNRIDTIKLIAGAITLTIGMAGIFIGNRLYRGEALAERVFEQVEQGQNEAAYASAREAWNEDPDNEMVISSVKLIYVTMINNELDDENYKQAFDLIEELKQMYPEDIDMLYYEAQLYNLTGKKQKALALYQAMVEKNNESALIWAEKGKIEYELKMYAEAYHSLSQALVLDPSLAEELEPLLEGIS